MQDDQPETQDFDFSTDKDTPLLVEVAYSIFTPGVNKRVQGVIHVVFVFLIINLLILMYLTDLNIHVVFLTLIAACLWASVAWCVESNVGSLRI